MKICIVTSGFGEPTIPFAHHLHSHGHTCDVFILSLQGRTNCGTLNFDNPISGHYIYPLSKNNEIYQYLNPKVSIYNVPYFIEKNKKYLIGLIACFKNIKIAKTLAKQIKVESYDVVLVVAHELMDALVSKSLKQQGVRNVHVIFHEILKSHFGAPVINDVVRIIKDLNFPLLTYSQHNRNILERLIATPVGNLYFGPFETYGLYKTNDRLIEGDYILFIGSIQPYKGLAFLYETITEKCADIPFKVVVAGSGNDHVLNDIKQDDRFVLINRYLGDKEFANLAKYAKCIICPYKAGSQSGITHTAMVFATPVIATNVAAFPEFIEEGKNGSIIEYGNKEDLIQKINFYISTPNIRYTIPDHLLWKNIVSEFERICKY